MVEMTRRKAMAGIGSALTVAVAGCSGSDDEGDTATSGDDGNGNGDDGNDNGENESGDNGEEGGSENIEILSHEVVEPDIGSYIEIHGEVQNNTGEEQSYIEVGATFRDEDETRVDDAFTNMTDVEDGETLVFEIMTTVEPDEYAEYELETSTDAF